MGGDDGPLGLIIKERSACEREREEGWHGSRRSFCLLLLLCSALALVGSGGSRWILVDSDWTGLTCSRSAHGGSGWINRLV